MPSSLKASLTTSQAQTLPRKCPASVRMCCRSTGRSSAAVQSREVSQAGSWLCQTSVWPRTFCLCARANATSVSAWVKSKRPCSGSTTSHFITFSGVTVSNSAPTAAR